MNLQSQRLWSLTGFWGVLWAIEWKGNFRGPEVPQFSMTQWHLISSFRWDNPCTSCTLTPDPSRPVEVHVLDFKTSLFPSVFGAPEGWGSSGCSQGWCQPPSSSQNTSHLTAREGQERDLPGDLSSITNPVADKHSASCRLRPSKVRANQRFTHSLLWHTV